MITPDRKHLVDQWTRKAEEDSVACNVIIFASAAGHLAIFQGASKALHCLHGRVPPKTHDLIYLIEALMPEMDLEALKEAALYLTPLATEFRYPGDTEEPSLSEAREAVSYAEAFVALATETKRLL